MERMMYTDGYLQGYIRGSFDGAMVGGFQMAKKYKAPTADLKGVDPKKMATTQAEMKDQIGTGKNKTIDTVQIEKGMTVFYNDFRNQSVCWDAAFRFSTMALNGDTPTEEELDAARKAGAESGC